MLLIVLEMRVAICARVRSLRPDRRAAAGRMYWREEIGVFRFRPRYGCFGVLVGVDVERLNALSSVISGIGQVTIDVGVLL